VDHALPGLTRYPKEVAFRGDAAFAKLGIHEALEKRGVKYAIRPGSGGRCRKAGMIANWKRPCSGRSPFWNENREKVGVAAVRNRRDSDGRKENICFTRRVTPSSDTFAVKKEIPGAS